MCFKYDAVVITQQLTCEFQPGCRTKGVLEATTPSPATFLSFNVCPHSAKSKQAITKCNDFEQFRAVSEKKCKEQCVILKADTLGSVEAITDCIEAVPIDEVAMRVVRSGVGSVSDSDVQVKKK